MPTPLPPSSDWTGSAVTEGGFKAAMTGLRSYLAGLLGTTGNAADARIALGVADAFPSGTAMLFAQTTAPAGWTKSTTHNDKTLRVVSGTAGSGGSVAFSAVFGRTATDGHTLTTSQMPSHTHSGGAAAPVSAGALSYDQTRVTTQADTAAAGGGQAHSHNLDLRVQYVDVIIATKD